MKHLCLSGTTGIKLEDSLILIGNLQNSLMSCAQLPGKVGEAELINSDIKQGRALTEVDM